MSVQEAIKLLKERLNENCNCRECERYKEILSLLKSAQTADKSPTEWQIHLAKKTKEEFYTDLRALIPEDLFERTKLSEPTCPAFIKELTEAWDDYKSIYGPLRPQEKQRQREKVSALIERDCDIIESQAAENKKLRKIADQRICDACKQSHPIDVICPPYEVRMKGDCWYHKAIEKLQFQLKQRDARIGKLEAENKESKGSCICMDCGKVIKTTEQSSHLKDCPREQALNPQAKPKETPNV